MQPHSCWSGLAPVIWLVTDVASGRVRTGAAIRAAAKIGVLSAAVSLWWIVALRIQSAYGIPILRYTETYESVASASTPAEIMRGLGYWFFYGGDRLDLWVEPALPYIDSPVVIALGFALAGAALLGFLTSFAGRASGAVLLLIGLAVSVGAAPLDNSTPYGALFGWFASDTTAGLALRSTPRAAPLVLFALALGLAGASEWLRARVAQHSIRPTRRWDLAIPIGVIALLGLQLFPWFTLDSMSSSLERDEQLPGYETELAEWLDGNTRSQSSNRVWEIPAADFANYRWGGTVDAVLPGLIERPYLARDLVLQGGAATSDLLNAFERRLPEGWFEPETLELVARRFGVDTIVVRNDLEHERYLLARPGPLWSDLRSVFGDPTYAGPIVRDETEIPLIDERTLADPDIAETFPVVAAFDLEPVPVVGSASADSPLVLVGDGDGLVDLAGARLLDPDRAVLYASTLHDLATDGKLDPAMIGPDTWWVVSDTNRKQARHWSTVSSNLGALEAEGPLTLDDDPGNQPLDVFRPDPDPDGARSRQTYAVHDADVADVRASYYGNRVAFTPGDAPAFAVDGDPTTAWRAGAFGPTGGLRFEVDLVEPAETDTITILQPITGAVNRFIIDARITLDAGRPGETSFDVVLDERSRTEPGQPIDLPVDSFETLRFEVLRDNIGEIADYTALPGVGLAEVTIPGVVDDRVVRTPSLDDFDIVDPDALADQRLTYMFTRQRIDPAAPNEAPAERSLVRDFFVPDSRAFALSGEARTSGQASEEQLAEIFSDPIRAVADRRLGGSPSSRGAAAIDGDPTTAWQTPFDEVVGATLTIDAPVTTDELRLTWRDDGRHSIPTEITLTGDDGIVRTIPVPATAPIDGIATAVLSIPGYSSQRSTITFSGVEERTTPEYFSSRPKVLPLGIAEIDIGGSVDTVDTAPLDTAPLDTACRDDLVTIDDRPVEARVVGTRRDAVSRSELTLEACGDPIELAAGRHRLRAVPGALSGFDIDRIVLDGAIDPPTTPTPGPTVDIGSADDTTFELTVAASSSPSWLILRQSWNAGWTASVDGEDLGPPVLIDGFANGWLLDPADGPRSVTLQWTPQRGVELALWFSLLAGIAVLGLLVWSRRDQMPATIVDTTEPGTSGWSRTSPILAAALVLGIAFLGGPVAAVGALVVLLARRRWPWLPLAIVLVAGSVVAGAVIASEWRYDYPPGPDWPSRFGWTGPLVWLAVAAVAVTAVMPAGITRTREMPERSGPTQ